MKFILNKKGKVQKIFFSIIFLLIAILFAAIILNAQNTTENTTWQEPVIQAVPLVPEAQPAVAEFNSTLSSSDNQSNDSQTQEASVSEKTEEVQKEKLEKTTKSGPELDLQIIYDEKITRGQKIRLKAIITNTGKINANNVFLNVVVPSGFAIQETDFEIGFISPGESKEVDVDISTSLSTSLGFGEIKFGLDYAND